MCQPRSRQYDNNIAGMQEEEVTVSQFCDGYARFFSTLQNLTRHDHALSHWPCSNRARPNHARGGRRCRLSQFCE